ncbi:GHMP kinase [Flavobacterium sp. SOK18b]|uniref:GYDIA family GHMP kinase n=1 Tax=Flavobacterium sp. SOK18b TaxID=797900 RepID=UPI0015FB806E|nr:GYDIA family GHMP kinase [Flavobacterium sp. SOK18b]MBB1194139.1 GHMP kinase [Flavobacterium sp. SOK18b]
MKKTFYSNGKLLITGEYLVLDGAQAFALPTKQGQNLCVETSNNNEIVWISYDFDGQIWFQDTLSFSDITNETKDQMESVKSTLTTILHEAYKLNPEFILNANGYTVTTELSFSKNWGLGTSSTLINNIAQWLQIDAFTLLKNSFGGSGYDIACAQHDTPILFQIKDGNPTVKKIEFNPEFKKNIYFVYLNKKQNSKTAIAAYHKNKKNKLAETIALNDQLTTAVYNAPTLLAFSDALSQHEAHLSSILETAVVKETLFPDFDGVVKSLGAWGGDFVMTASEDNPTAYFKSKGYETIIPYEEMIL